MHISLQAAPDHILGLTKFRTPIVAIEELIWNSLDADAKTVSVALEVNAMFGLNRIVVTDDGRGLPYAESREAFENIGGSPKLKIALTPGGRRPHGKSGQGRLKAFGLGRSVKWHSRFQHNGKVKEYSITGHKTTIKEFDISDPVDSKEARTGMVVEITGMEATWPSLLESDKAAFELSQRLALYLNQYPGNTILYDGCPVDAEIGQTYKADYPLEIHVAGDTYPGTLTVIEWNRKTDRALYLCDRQGFARNDRPPGIQAKGWDFTAYVRSELVEKLEKEDALGLDELHPAIKALIDSSKDALKSHFRRRESQRASELVEKWKAEEVYPYDRTPSDPIALAEKEVFDVCAVNVNEYLPSFDGLDKASKRLTFQLIKQSLESNPTALQTILREVLALPKEKQEEFATLLEKTKLSTLLNAAKIVVDRIDFLGCLEELLFGTFKKSLNEPRQLHPILSSEMWLFGEQYNMGVDEESLTNLLRSHVKILGREELITNSDHVTDLDGTNRFLDLMLYSRYPYQTEGQYEHLVIELKRPSIKLGMEEINQIEKYAFAVSNDPRFNKQNVQWTFLLIGTALDDFATNKCSIADRKFGHIHTGKVNIHVRPWSMLLDEAKWRYEFFRSKLEYQATSDNALTFLKFKYAQYFPDDPTETPLTPKNVTPTKSSKAKGKGRGKSKGQPTLTDYPGAD